MKRLRASSLLLEKEKKEEGELRWGEEGQGREKRKKKRKILRE
jgi:hypothetical protein